MITFMMKPNIRYNFTPIQRYKTLDAEEAEERFANRGKVAKLLNLRIEPNSNSLQTAGFEQVVCDGAQKTEARPGGC